MAKAHGLSQATIRRIWKHHNLKPHCVKTSKLSRDKHFVEKLYDVVGLCINPPDKSLKDYLDGHNQNPRVFVWTASVEHILTKLAKCKEALDSLH